MEINIPRTYFKQILLIIHPRQLQFMALAFLLSSYSSCFCVNMCFSRYDNCLDTVIDLSHHTCSYTNTVSGFLNEGQQREYAFSFLLWRSYLIILYHWWCPYLTVLLEWLLLEGKFEGRITRRGLYIRWKDTKSAVKNLEDILMFDPVQYLLCPEMQFLSLPLR